MALTEEEINLRNERSRKCYQKNKEKIRNQAKQSYLRNQEKRCRYYRERYHKNKEKNKERLKEYGKRNYQKNKDRMRNYTLKRNYGITSDKYAELFNSQNGVCAICGRTNKDGRRLAIDHDHITKKVRGLLCNKCNVSLAGFGDDKHLLIKILSYLEGK